MIMKWFKCLVLGLLACALSGCEMVVMNPSGDVALQQSQLIVYSTVLMLIVIVPVMALTLFFAFKYRASNTNSTYDPEWDHSISLEIVVWSVPLAIIICLAGLTWVATHRLEPYNPLKRIGENRPVPEGVKPLVIKAVAMDWKWLFIYPEQGIATVNEVAGVVDRPIEFQITSTTVMNSMYIPALAGQIYAMPGMQTKLNAVINEVGVFEGFSANYSGEGFSKMRFKFYGLSEKRFENWVASARNKGQGLDRAELIKLDKPSIGHPVTYYSSVDKGLWPRIINLCITDDKLCIHDLMVVDALGGGGLDGLWNRERCKGLCSAENVWQFMALLPEDKRKRADDIIAAFLNRPVESLRLSKEPKKQSVPPSE